MKKIFIVAMLGLLIAGCKTTNDARMSAGLYEYTQSVQKAVRKNYFGSLSYTTQGCTLKVIQPPGEKIQRVEVVSIGGFMCDRAVEAINDTVSSGEFPAKRAGLPTAILFDFRP